MEKYKFDLEKAMIGCPVVTRDGRRVEILDWCYSQSNKGYMLGKIENPDGNFIAKLFLRHNGRVVADGRISTEAPPCFDLFLSEDDRHWEELKMLYGKAIERREDDRLEMTKVPDYNRELTEFEKMVRDFLCLAKHHNEYKKHLDVKITDNEVVVPVAEKLYSYVANELAPKRPKGPTVAEFAAKLLETIPNDAVVISNNIHYLENENLVRFEK